MVDHEAMPPLSQPLCFASNIGVVGFERKQNKTTFAIFAFVNKARATLLFEKKQIKAKNKLTNKQANKQITTTKNPHTLTKTSYPELNNSLTAWHSFASTCEYK